MTPARGATTILCSRVCSVVAPLAGAVILRFACSQGKGYVSSGAPVASLLSGAGVGAIATLFVVAGVASCLPVPAGADACFFGGSQPGARETIIDIIRPSIMGVLSMMADPFNTSAIWSST